MTINRQNLWKVQLNAKSVQIYKRILKRKLGRCLEAHSICFQKKKIDLNSTIRLMGMSWFRAFSFILFILLVPIKWKLCTFDLSSQLYFIGRVFVFLLYEYAWNEVINIDEQQKKTLIFLFVIRLLLGDSGKKIVWTFLIQIALFTKYSFHPWIPISFREYFNHGM